METGHHIHTACMHIHSLEEEKKWHSANLHSTMYCLTVHYVVYCISKKSPHINVCVCVCVCASRGQRSVSEGLGNAQPNSSQTKLYLCIIQREGFGKHWKVKTLASVWMTACWMHVCLSRSPFFHLVSWHVAVPKNTVLSSSLPTERSV